MTLIDDMAPTEPPEKTAGIGDNRPPTSEAEFDKLLARTETLVRAANLWLEKVPEIKDEDTAKACEDYLSQVRALGTDRTGQLDKLRMEINEPHRKAIKTNDDRFKPLKAKLDKIAALLNPLRTRWMQKKEEERKEAARKAEEEALKALQDAEDAKKKAAEQSGDVIGSAVDAEEKQRKADDAIRAADRIASARTQVKGDYAKRASTLKTFYSAKITDPMMVLRQLWATGTPAEKAEITELARKLASAKAREQKQAFVLPGAELHEEQKAA